MLKSLLIGGIKYDAYPKEIKSLAKENGLKELPKKFLIKNLNSIIGLKFKDKNGNLYFCDSGVIILGRYPSKVRFCHKKFIELYNSGEIF